jgi:hypothetical protein
MIGTRRMLGMNEEEKPCLPDWNFPIDIVFKMSIIKQSVSVIYLGFSHNLKILISKIQKI